MRDQTILSFGATVRGPRNRDDKRPNQDAWVRANGKFGNLITVCDGLGSRSNSRLGARAACKAVCRAARNWPGLAVVSDPKHVIRLIEILWRLALGSNTVGDCATTCTLALRELDGRILLAGLGDSVAICRFQDGQIEVKGRRPDTSFGSETRALGVPHQIGDWWIHTVEPANGRTILLASDGVSDDLTFERIGGFVDWLLTTYGRLPNSERSKALRSMLQKWPVPNHTDDKTIAILAENPGALT